MKTFLNKILSKFGYIIINTDSTKTIIPEINMKYGKIDEFVSKMKIPRNNYIDMLYKDDKYISKLEQQCIDALLNDIKDNIEIKSYADLNSSNYIIECYIKTVRK